MAAALTSTALGQAMAQPNCVSSAMNSDYYSLTKKNL